MNIIKKITAYMLATIIAIASIGIFKTEVKASEGSLTIKTSANSVISGKEITVTVKLDYTDKLDGEDLGISVVNYDFSYDSNLFEYIGGDAGGSGYAGVIPINYLEMNFPTSLTWTFKFKAKDVGEGAFSITSGLFINGDNAAFNPIGSGVSSSTVKVMAVGSDDATLSSLQIAGVKFSEAFNKKTTSYTAYVANSVTSVKIAATATQGGKIEISGDPNKLVVGKNKIVVTSYAPNGDKMQYKITIIRLEPPTEPPTTVPTTPAPTEPPTEPIDDINIKIGEEEYRINSSYSVDLVPKGFTTDIGSFKGKDVLAAVNEEYNVTLFYLMNKEQIGAFYVFDSEHSSFCRYATLKTETQQYILLNGDFTDDKPGDCEKGDVEINGVLVEAYVSNTDDNFCYFYAVNSAKAKNWYCYDKTENTIQRVFATKLEVETTTSVETETETVVSVDDGNKEIINSLMDSNNKLSSDNEQMKRIQLIVYIVAGTIIVILLAIIIILIVAKHKKDSDDADEYDEETVEETEDEAEDDTQKIEDNEVKTDESEQLDEAAATMEANEISEEEAANFDAEAEQLATSEEVEQSVMGALVEDIRNIMEKSNESEQETDSDSADVVEESCSEEVATEENSNETVEVEENQSEAEETDEIIENIEIQSEDEEQFF